MSESKWKRGLAKGLGIQLDPYGEREHRRQNHGAIGGNVDPYEENDGTTIEFLRDHVPSRDGIVHYIQSLFPFWAWIFHYNLTWLIGDLVAGITVGFVVVPQGMAYALLANLPPEYGLYTSFVGFLLYWAFATSKDITIGTVAVMSTIVGNIVNRVQAIDKTIPAEQIARALAVISGAVLLGLGLLRLGFLVELIPLVAIASFMTGAAISILVGQVPGMMGISGVNTRGAPYITIIETLKGLPRTKLDAAMGLSALVMLYGIRIFCNIMGKKQPHRQKMWFFLSTLRMAFVILLYILISWLANRGIFDDKKTKFKVLGNVPSGFQHAGAPVMNSRLIELLGPDIPTTILVLIIEHIAISKSFGRINNYIINPSQELVAIGFTNVFGPFLGAYPATGSFSRTAIKSKAGVRTPLAGIFTAVIVLLALYALTSVFFYIPSASLSALIIHAVGDLITPPNTVYQFWRTSPLEVLIFFAGVLFTIFTNIENGIYLNMGLSGGLLIWRHMRAPGHFLGHLKTTTLSKEAIESGNVSALDSDALTRQTYLPHDRTDGVNPHVPISSPYPGVFIYRFPHGFDYTNCAHHLDFMTEYIYKLTRRTVLDRFAKLGDRPWNDPGPRRGEKLSEDIALRPTLKAVILDFSAVNFVDVTSVQALIDLRYQFNLYADPQPVEWHFAHVSNRWTKRALVAAGFGIGYPNGSDAVEKPGASVGSDSLNGWNPLFSVAAHESSSTLHVAPGEPTTRPIGAGQDLEAGEGPNHSRLVAHTLSAKTEVHVDGEKPKIPSGNRVVPVYGLNRPFFHTDVVTAVEAAVANAETHGLS